MYSLNNNSNICLIYILPKNGKINKNMLLKFLYFSLLCFETNLYLTQIIRQSLLKNLQMQQVPKSTNNFGYEFQDVTYILAITYL